MSDTVDPRSRSELRSLLRAIEESGWEYARVEIDGVTLTVSSDADFIAREGVATPVPPAAPARAATSVSTESPAPTAETTPAGSSTPGATTSTTDDAHTVTAPSIGLFWRSPKPGAPPFVEVGDHVEADATVCIIEVMKLMTHVPAGVAGTVRAIHVSNGDMVEHGTPLVDVEPEAAS